MRSLTYARTHTHTMCQFLKWPGAMPLNSSVIFKHYRGNLCYGPEQHVLISEDQAAGKDTDRWTGSKAVNTGWQIIVKWN